MAAISRQRGFTMIELLLVMVIMAVLAAIAIPVYLSQRAKAKDAGTRSGVRTIEIGIMAYAVEHSDTFPATLDSNADLVDANGELYLDRWPVNAWSDQPMRSDPSARGDYTYIRTSNSFTLSGHLSSGEFVVP